MKKANVLLMTWDEFDEVVDAISNGEAGIANENGEWFYVTTEAYDLNEIEADLSIQFGQKVKDVLIDLSEEDDCVVVILE